MSDYKVPLSACPVGLFLQDGCLGLKTEYKTQNEHTGFYKSDAYVVASGEYFWGGTDNERDRENLMVLPVEMRGVEYLRIVTNGTK